MFGMIAAYNSDYETATKFIREGLPLAQELGNGYCVAWNLKASAVLFEAKAKEERAAKLYGAAEALRRAVGAPLSPVDLPDHEHSLAAARAQLEEAVWEEAWAEGQAMTIEEAVEYALFEEEPTAPPVSSVPEQASTSAQPASLTRRQKEIAALVARGLTNRQIASKLIVSERTVDNHVANILKKLGLSSREQVAARMAGQLPG
jgi:non-specific serine/threonine protein kinase